MPPARVRIISAPPGEAPADIRRAWVGLTLPIVGRGPMTGFGSGVLTGPKSILELLCGRALIHPKDAVRGQPLHARLATEGHVSPQLVAQDVERIVHALGAADGETPEHGAPDGHDARAPRERLEHGGAAAEAAVDDDLGAVPDGVGDGGQRVDGRLGAVELAAAVIGDPDDLHAHVDGALGVARSEEHSLNSSHITISYAVFCLKKKTKPRKPTRA